MTFLYCVKRMLKCLQEVEMKKSFFHSFMKYLKYQSNSLQVYNGYQWTHASLKAYMIPGII